MSSWKSANEATALKAIAQLEKSTEGWLHAYSAGQALALAARESPNPNVRVAAINALTAPRTLTEASQQDADASVRAAAASRLDAITEPAGLHQPVPISATVGSTDVSYHWNNEAREFSRSTRVDADAWGCARRRATEGHWRCRCSTRRARGAAPFSSGTGCAARDC
ncbi:MAG: hypothetical protein FWD63_00755 [Propionibacteriaceae bacterium]|nr:hypothetical protein [Propionibacteriaceae bacterium]